MRSPRLPVFLFLIFAAAWALLAAKPLDPFAWFLENIVVLIGAPVVLISYWKFRLSNLSYALIFIFGMLHILGAHYTYGGTPWGDWISALFGWERNHYDRITHFLYGMLMLPVLADALQEHLPKSLPIRGLLLVSVVTAMGALYEVAEFVVGVLVDPGAGLAFLGFQGDVWDTQKDMLLQALGALLGLLLFLPLRGNDAAPPSRDT